MVKDLTKAFSCRIFANEKTPKAYGLQENRACRRLPVE